MFAPVRARLDGRLLRCGFHGHQYGERHGVIRPCPWPGCSNASRADVLDFGDVVCVRERWMVGFGPK